MADDQEQKREEMSELPDIPDVPPPPYPGPPDGTQYPPQQVPPYQGATTYPPQQAPQGAPYPPQGVTYPQGGEYPPKEGTFYPPPGYQQGQYPPAYGQQQYPTAYPSGYQAVAQGGYPTQAYHGQGCAPPVGSMVVTSQPVAAAVVPMSTEPKPETYLVLSVITCLCCSPIFGLIAICFAVAADSAYASGDVNGARRSGRTALILCICGIILTLIVLAMNLLLRTSMYHH